MAKKLTMILAALMLIVFALPALADGEAVIKNGDFEKADSSNFPSSWEFHSYETEATGDETIASASLTDDAERGSKVLHISVKSDDDAAVFQSVKVEPSSYYRLTCWIKTSGVKDGAGANIALRDIIAVSDGLFGDNGWTRVTLTGRTGPTQKSIVVSCRVGGYGAEAMGEAWFDDFTIEKLSSAEGEIIPFYSGVSTDDTEDEQPSVLPVIIIIAAAAVVILAVVFFIVKKNGKSTKDHAENEEPELIPPIESYAEDKARKLDDIKGRSFFDMKGDTIPAPTDTKLHFTKLDRIYVLVLTGVYALIALFRLGTLNFPTSSWSGDIGDTVRIEFGRSVKLSDVWQNSGISHVKYKLITDNGEEIQFSERDGREYGHMFRWTSISKTDVSKATATTGVTLEIYGGDNSRPQEPDLILLELVFFDENGERIDCTSTAAELFDEQDTVPEYSSYYNGMYFDELYHGRTALEHILNNHVYEWTHPPLGKLIIAVGILIFGMKPFGWRIMGVLFGIAMVPILYCMGKRLLKRSELALFSTCLFTFDFMHFTQTRIATIDVYGVFFILLMTYYMYIFLTMDIGDDVRKMFKPLALSGIFFGLGCASKWIGMYMGLGLAIMFFVKLILMGVKSYRLGKLKKYRDAGLVKKYWRTFGILCWWCVIFFIIVPAVIYAASYFRYYTAQWKPARQAQIYAADATGAYSSASDVKLSFTDALNTYVNGVIGNQKDMFNYHSQLKSEHSASSTWWMWLFDLRPTWFYLGGSGYKTNYVGTIDSFGNPMVWTAGTLSTLALIGLLIFHRKKFPLRDWFIFVCIGSNLLPWVLVPRSTYSYHFFATVPYISLAAGSMMGYIEDVVEAKRRAKENESGSKKGFVGKLKYVWMGVVILLFGLFFPVLSGIEAPRSYISALQWVPFHKIEVIEESTGKTLKTYRIGWTLTSYEWTDSKDPDRYVTKIYK